MQLSKFLEHWRREHGRCGARLAAATFAHGEIGLIFTMVNWRTRTHADARLRVSAHGVEDWQLAPCHTLLEGSCEIELVLEDPRLTRDHLRSRELEDERTEFPQRLAMLRHGDCWVVAESFTVEWTTGMPL